MAEGRCIQKRRFLIPDFPPHTKRLSLWPGITFFACFTLLPFPLTGVVKQIFIIIGEPMYRILLNLIDCVRLRWIAIIVASSSVFAVDPPVESPLLVTPAVTQMSPTIDQTTYAFVVSAKNTSNRTLDISEFKGGCGCITFSSNATTLAPGDSADISVVFDFRDFIGPQKRTLSIMTKSADDKEAVKNSFQLVGDIPSAIQFSKKAAIWLYGEKVSTKELAISVKPDYTISGLHVEDMKLNHFVTVEQALSDDGRLLTVRVTPTTTNIDDVSPTEKVNLQVPYVVKYNTQNGTTRYERFWVLLAKRPELKDAPASTPKPATQEGAKP
jgi:hypothetical protein